MVKERVEENIHGLVKDSLNERLDGIDWSEYVDDYIRSKIYTIIEDPVRDEVAKFLDDVTIEANLHW